jgi:heptosyltransferase-1
VLACPLAGWGSKQWPLEYYAAIAKRLQTIGLPLVLNGAPAARELLAGVAGARPHLSTIAGLLDATRRAAAVIGVDSGPLHVAAALNKPGVALYGPTDPARNGPYGNSFTILRSPRAITTYRRGTEIDPAMRDLSPEQVFDALRQRLPR